MARCGHCGRDGMTVAEIREHYGATAAASTPAKPKPVEITEGFWVLDGGIYKVQRAVHGSGYLYAKQLDVGPGDEGAPTGSWIYAPGALRKLRELGAHELTKDEAASFGQLYGFCCICGRTLTNEESIAAGIGPICAGKQGWS